MLRFIKECSGKCCHRVIPFMYHPQEIALTHAYQTKDHLAWQGYTGQKHF